jgi:hypothetical protein
MKCKDIDSTSYVDCYLALHIKVSILELKISEHFIQICCDITLMSVKVVTYRVLNLSVLCTQPVNTRSIFGSLAILAIPMLNTISTIDI